METRGLDLSPNGKRISAIGAIAALILTFCCVLPASAQFTSSSLNGTIIDPSGSVVAGAHVTAKNEATGFSQTVNSNSTGSYTFPTLPIGTYVLTIEAQGFRTYSQSGIALTVNQVATQNVTLEIGSVSQSVSVTSQAPLVTTSSATVGELVDTQQVVDLPLNGRTIQSLLFLGAGTVNVTSDYCAYGCIGGTFPSEQYAKINGTGATGVVYLLDGANYNDLLLNTNLPYPNPDAVEEFNTQTSNMTAEYGNAAGGIVSAVAKSGTNQIHGDVFEFIRNGDLDSKNYFASAADTLKRNQFGFTLGGPVIKNKLFYFGSYQGTRISTAPGGEIDQVPTAQERTGDLSALNVQLVNPVTGIPFGGNQVPVSPVASALLADIPLPNGPGNQLTFVGPPQHQHQNEYLFKMDYRHNNQQISGHYLFSNIGQAAATSKTNLLDVAGGTTLRLQNVSLNYVYTASPNLLFNTWYSLNDESGASQSGAPFGFSKIGVAIAEPSVPTLNASVGGWFSIGTGYFGPFVRRAQQVREDFTWIKGKNEMHFGGSYGRVHTPKNNQYQEGGSFGFSDSLSGNNLGDFIYGQATSFAQGGGIYYNFGQNRVGLFAQDNWHLQPRLTLQAGLRWDPFLPYYEAKGRVGCYEPGQQSARYPNAPVGLLYGGANHDPGCPTASYSRTLNNFEPRLGFAFQPSNNGKMSVRGGFGLYYSTPNVVMMQDVSSIAPFAPSVSLTDVSFADPYGSAGVANPFPAQFGPAVPGADATFSLPTALPYILDRHLKASRAVAWNLTVERQLGMSWLLQVGYVGNTGSDLSGTGDQEEGQQELNPAVYVPGASTEANTQQRRIDPVNFSNVDVVASTVRSNYNALQLTLRKQFAYGLSLDANFTWSKSLDDFAPLGSSTYINTKPFDELFDYGPSPGDVTRVFNFSPIYHLPGLKGNGWQTRIANGWSASGIVSWQSGTPFTVYSGMDNSFSGVGADRADFTGSKLSQAVLDPNRSHSQLVNQYFNTTLFAANAVGTFGNTGKNVLRGPGLFNTDFSLLKNIRITERWSSQFRAEAFNFFNNVNFSNPDGTFTDGTFGQITAAGSPRILQFALKVLF